MRLRPIAPADFDWFADRGAAADLRRIVASASQYDGVEPLNEEATLALRHEGLRGASLWLAEDAGFALVQDELLNLVVDPVSRGRGVATALLNNVVNARDTSLHAWSHVDHPAAGALARAYDFDRVRDLWVMGRALAPGSSGSAALRTFEADNLAAIVRINARAFAWHPEQGRLTKADFQRRMSEAWFDPSGLIVALVDGQIAGFHWTKIHPGQIGEVYVVAVDPDFSGRGIGKALTEAGLAHLHEQGCTRVILYVDADNTAATRLYEGLGFTKIRGEAQYSRPAAGS